MATCKHCRQECTAEDLEKGRTWLADLGVKDPAEFPACDSCAYSRGRYYCPCGSGEWAEDEYDGHGIYLCKCCDKCRAQKMRGYRSDIKEAYETDEPIEAD